MSKHRLERNCEFSNVGVTKYTLYFETDSSSDVVQSTVVGNYFTVTHSAEGTYSVTLNDVYWKLLSWSAQVIGTGDEMLKLTASPTVGAETTTLSLTSLSAGIASNLGARKMCFELTVKSSISGSAV